MAEILDDIAYLTQDIGPHPAGTEEEQRAALYLADQMQKEAGFATVVEDFQCSSNDQMVNYICFGAALLAALCSLIFPALNILWFFLGLAGAVLFGLEVFNKPVLSRFFRTGASQNVVAKYQPTSGNAPARRRKVILVAGYDSGRVLQEERAPYAKFLPLFQQASAIALAVSAFILLLRMSIFAGDTGPLGSILSFLLVLCVILFAASLARAGLHQTAPYNQSANNNAAGVAVLLDVARQVGNGLVSAEELQQRAEGEGSTVHGEDAAYEAGVVPEGANLSYETELSAQESLAAAKAAIAALTGKPVADKVPVTDISSKLVRGGGLVPEDEESISSVRFEVSETPKREPSTSPLGRTTVKADLISRPEEPEPEQFEEAPAEVFHEEQPVQAEVPAEEPAEEPASAAPAAASAFGAFAAAGTAVAPAPWATSGSSSDKTPSWAKSAQEKARANKPNVEEPAPKAGRSRYADTVAARMMDQQPAKSYSALTSSGSSVEDVPLNEDLSSRLQAMRDEIEAAEAPHFAESAQPAAQPTAAPVQPEPAAQPEPRAQVQQEPEPQPEPQDEQPVQEEAPEPQAAQPECEEAYQPAEDIQPEPAPRSARGTARSSAEQASSRFSANFGALRDRFESAKDRFMPAADQRQPHARPSVAAATGVAAAQAKAAQPELEPQALTDEQLDSNTAPIPAVPADDPDATLPTMPVVDAAESGEPAADERNDSFGGVQMPHAFASRLKSITSRFTGSQSDAAQPAEEADFAPTYAEEPYQEQDMFQAEPAEDQATPASPSETASISAIDVSQFMDTEQLDEEQDAPIRRISTAQNDPVAADEEPVEGATAAFTPIAVPVENEPEPEAQPQVAAPIVGMEEMLQEEPAAADEPERKVIVLPDVSAAAVSTEDAQRQRAPMAEASKAKPLLSNMLPHIGDEVTGSMPSVASLQANLKLPTLGDTGSHEAVSMTGSFSTVGGTGSFAPVDDSLVSDVAPEERYVEDADDSAYEEEFTETGAFAGPDYVDMPKSRAGGFFGRFRSKKNKKKGADEVSVNEWVNVDDSYNARSVGKARGDWSSFQNESGTADESKFVDVDYRETDFNKRDWNGGAFSLSRLKKGEAAEGADPADAEAAYIDPNPALRIDGDSDTAEQINRELRKLQDFRHPDIDTEVWFVALGSEMYSHSGINAFLEEHAAEMKGAIIVNLEGLGAGTLSCIEQEGVYKRFKPSSRIKRFVRQASERSGVGYRNDVIASRETPASIAMAHGVQAFTVAGMADGNTALFSADNDVIENIDPEALKDASNFVMNILKSV